MGLSGEPRVWGRNQWAYQELAATRGVIRPLSAGHAELDQHEVTVGHSWWPRPRMISKHRCLPACEASRDQTEPTCAGGRARAAFRKRGDECSGFFMIESARRYAHAQFARDTRLNVFVVSTCSGPLSVAVRTGAEPAHG